jgi:predicted flap endonuclease-1-like 5' DNA nuclease
MGMNDTSPTSASGMSLLPDSIETLTAIHFTIIGVLALLVIAGLLWGIRAKRSRLKAAREVIAHAEEAGVPPEPIEPTVQERRAEQSQTQTVAPAPAVVPTPAPVERTPPVQSAPAPVPVAPSLAPVADAPEARVSETSDPLADERIVAASPLEASPATEVAPPPPIETAPIETAPIETAPVEARAAAQSYAEGPVTQLKGLGPKVASQLGALGVSTVGQMAALSESEAQGIDAQLGNFTGRMGRDRWIEQARLLAAGDKAGFEAVFGKL